MSSPPESGEQFRKLQEEEPVCEKCGGYGWVISDDNTARQCDCGIVEEKEFAERLKAAGIPRRFLGKTLDNFAIRRGDRVRKEIRQIAKGYAQTFHPSEHGLFLTGPVGSGKTHIAAGILREVIARGYTGLFWNFNDLLANLRSTYSLGQVSRDDEFSILDRIDRNDLLVLDDIGAEAVSDWVRDRLYLIINRRYEDARPTIITTNCDEAELEARVGPRIVSRLFEMCAEEFPPFPDQDFRRAMMR